MSRSLLYPCRPAGELVLADGDHVTHEAVVAFDDADGRMVGVARYAVWPGSGDTADVAVAIDFTLDLAAA